MILWPIVQPMTAILCEKGTRYTTSPAGQFGKFCKLCQQRPLPPYPEFPTGGFNVISNLSLHTPEIDYDDMVTAQLMFKMAWAF